MPIYTDDEAQAIVQTILQQIGRQTRYLYNFKDIMFDNTGQNPKLIFKANGGSVSRVFTIEYIPAPDVYKVTVQMRSGKIVNTINEVYGEDLTRIIEDAFVR